MEKNNCGKIIKLNKVKNELVSEDDILHLFFALVKLVRKNAAYEAEKSVHLKIQLLTEKIESLEKSLKEKTQQIAELKLSLKSALIKD